MSFFQRAFMIVAAIFAAALGTPASATLFTHTYVGITDDSPPSALPWSLTYTYESTAPAVLIPAENRAEYPTALTELSVTVGSLTFTFDPTGGSDAFGSYIAINDNLSGVGDVYRVRGVLQDAHGFSGLLVTLVLTNSNGTALSSTALPNFQPDPAQFEIQRFNLSHTVGFSHPTLWDGVFAEIGDNPAPELPAPGGLGILAFALLFAARKRIPLR
jgi:hypothetical protein